MLLHSVMLESRTACGGKQVGHLYLTKMSQKDMLLLLSMPHWPVIPFNKDCSAAAHTRQKRAANEHVPASTHVLGAGLHLEAVTYNSRCE